MVWTPEQTGLFLDFVAQDRHYALWHLIAYRGLRRGEACSLDRSELSLTRGTVTIRTGSDQATDRHVTSYSDTSTRTAAWSSPMSSAARSTSPRSPTTSTGSSPATRPSADRRNDPAAADGPPRPTRSPRRTGCRCQQSSSP
jgi:integrase